MLNVGTNLNNEPEQFETLLYKENYIKKNTSTVIAEINMKDLLESQTKIKNPPVQRRLDTSKVEEIILYQTGHYKKKSYFNYCNNIIINCCRENKHNYLLDGQHRYESAKKLYKDGYNISLSFEIVYVDTYNEVKTNFEILNKNTEQPIWSEDIDKEVGEDVCDYYFTMYNAIFKTTKTRKKPYIHKNDFRAAVSFLFSELNNVSGKEYDMEDLIKLIDNKNMDVGNWPIETWNNKVRKQKSWGEIKLIADEFKFHLGMFKKEDEEYVFEWVNAIICEKKGLPVTKKKRKRRKKKTIPPQLRQDVWERWVGNKTTYDVCLCCRKSPIRVMSFQCGHIQAEAEGGPLNINNLTPVCVSCNSSMGKKNMIDYITEFYPNNIAKFKDKLDNINSTDVTI
jgi:hypothetical protein